MTHVHAFIASPVHYCNTVMTGSPRFITDKLQRVLNAAARVITGMRKFDRSLSHLLHSELHWLTFLNVSSISSESQLFISTSRTGLPSICWAAACVRLTFPVVSACGQPTDVSWSCHDTVAESLVVERSPSQIRWSGTWYRTLFGTQR